jgi:hypothetical protein
MLGVHVKFQTFFTPEKNHFIVSVHGFAFGVLLNDFAGVKGSRGRHVDRVSIS